MNEKRVRATLLEDHGAPPPPAGALLLPDGRAAPGRHLRAPGLLPEHAGDVHRPRGRPGERDALRDQGPVGELHHQRRPQRVLQLDHSPARRLLRGRAPHLGPDAQPQPEPALLDPHGEGARGGGGLRPARGGPQIRRQPVQAPAQQEAPARLPLLLPQLEDLGRRLHPGRLEALQEEEDGQGVDHNGGGPGPLPRAPLAGPCRSDDPAERRAR